MPSELTMTPADREQFLAAVHIGVLAVESADGPPTVAPVWYEYEPGGDVMFTTEYETVKYAAIEAAGRATLCVQREEYPYAYVTVDGPTTTEEATVEQRTRIATRYLGQKDGEAYVQSTLDTPNVLVRLTAQRWRTQDFSRFSIPGT